MIRELTRKFWVYKACSGAEVRKRRKGHSPKRTSTKSALAEATHAVKTAFCELSCGELSATNCRAVKSLSTNGRDTRGSGSDRDRTCASHNM